MRLALFLCMITTVVKGFLSNQHRPQTLRRPAIIHRLCCMSNNDNLVVVIAGPTAAGKSDVAAKLCALRGGLIVSADSVQAYKGVEIGANKPSPAERKATPHLLVDIVGADEQYNAAEWRRDAVSCIELLLKNNNNSSADNNNDRIPQLTQNVTDAKQLKKYDADSSVLPVVVGGTMMYLQWLVYGKPDAMRPNEEAAKKARVDIEKYQSQEVNGWDDAAAHVASLNPTFAARVENLAAGDWYRLRRTVEIAYTAKDDVQLIESLYSGERQGGLESLGYDVRCFFLCPSDRMKHTAVIDERCEEMILRGLLKETADLQVTDSMPDMACKAIGYRQILDYLGRTDGKEQDVDALDAFLNDFTTATRRYAKKQMAWFRKDSKFAFVPVSLDATSKEDRVVASTKMIAEMCSMSRSDYEDALSSEDTAGNIPVSYQTRLTNLAQGKGMKLYQFKRYKLERGSPAFDAVLAEADECTRRVKAHRESKASEPEEKRIRLL